jgi:hypothetical protein
MILEGRTLAGTSLFADEVMQRYGDVKRKLIRGRCSNLGLCGGSVVHLLRLG